MKSRSLVFFLSVCLLSLSFYTCKKESELSDSEVTDIAQYTLMLLCDALSQANAGSTSRLLQNHPAIPADAKQMMRMDIITRSVHYEGTGAYVGIIYDGTITANTDNGFYEGEHNIRMNNVNIETKDAKYKNILVKFGLGTVTFNGNAYGQWSHQDYYLSVQIVMSGREYQFEYFILIDQVGTQVTYDGKVIYNGKDIKLKYP